MSTGASLTGVTVKLNVLSVGVEVSSFPSSTLTLNEAAVVSVPSCKNFTFPAFSCVGVKLVTSVPFICTFPFTRVLTAKVTPASVSSTSVCPKSAANKV